MAFRGRNCTKPLCISDPVVKSRPLQCLEGTFTGLSIKNRLYIIYKNLIFKGMYVKKNKFVMYRRIRSDPTFAPATIAPVTLSPVGKA